MPIPSDKCSRCNEGFMDCKCDSFHPNFGITPAIIIAEANFLQDLLHRIYYGKERFTELNWKSISKRLQSIRDEARKQ